MGRRRARPVRLPVPVKSSRPDASLYANSTQTFHRFGFPSAQHSTCPPTGEPGTWKFPSAAAGCPRWRRSPRRRARLVRGARAMALGRASRQTAKRPGHCPRRPGGRRSGRCPRRCFGGVPGGWPWTVTGPKQDTRCSTSRLARGRCGPLIPPEFPAGAGPSPCRMGWANMKSAEFL